MVVAVEITARPQQQVLHPEAVEEAEVMVITVLTVLVVRSELG